MSRTKRDFPTCYKGEGWATKYGRDGQYSPGASDGWRNGRRSCRCWLCRVVATPNVKKSVSRQRRAYEKKEARTRVYECVSITPIGSANVV